MAEDPCKKKVSNASGEQLSEAQSEKLLAKIKELAGQRAESTGLNIEDAMRQVAGELSAQERLAGEREVRNLLLDVRARRQVKSFVRKFPTLGEGLIALMEGSSKTIEGGRRSVDYQAKALHGKYLGRLIAEMEEAGVLKAFRDGKLSREIYIEMGELRDGGTPGKTKSTEAQKIAKIIEGVTSDMVGRQNRSGALIDRIPGYVVRQTHDMDEIRRAGGLGRNQENRQKSLQIWKDFTLPLLDLDRTMAGENIDLFMKNVHEALYTGTHGPDVDEFQTNVFGMKQDLSKKVSKSRVLHFKDADAAWQYNEKFGKKSIMDQVFSDIFYRARSISLMENFGPSAARNFDQLLRELNEEARLAKDAAAQSDSLRNWRIQTLFDTLTGKIDIPVNHSLSRHSNTVRAVTIMAKMGGTLINALSDKVFMNQEMAYQGISRLDTWSKQLTGMAARGEEEKRTLRLMGVAMDGIIGNTISRYTTHTTTSGVMHKLQQKMFDLNFMNWWTDVNKASAAELMSAHLGEHAGVTMGELPGELKSVLSLYNITPLQWDAIRSTAWTPEGGESKMITPDQLSKIPSYRVKAVAIKDPLGKIYEGEPNQIHGQIKGVKDWLSPEKEWEGWEAGFIDEKGNWLTRDEAALITSPIHIGNEFDALDFNKVKKRLTLADLVEERGLKVTDANIQRMRDDLDLSLRTYFQDRIDFAIPTPGVAEKKWTTLGTQAGTPLGESIRMLMMFKAFPITIMSKIMGREVYGRGAKSAGQWLLNDHKGKFNTAQLIGMTIIAGYISGAIKDALKGRQPKPWRTEDGKLDMHTLQDAAARGGGLGIMGDFLFNEHGRNYRQLTGVLAGPVVGQLDPLAEIATLAKQGQGGKALDKAGKFGIDNTPFINLIYIRPVLDYFVFWNMQEALDPGSLRRMESAVEKRGQHHWMRPSER